MKTLLALLLSALPLVAQTGRLTMAWDENPLSDQVLLYKFYKLSNTNETLLGTSKTNLFVYTNYNPQVSHMFAVSASNACCEGQMSATLFFPRTPPPPVNLAPVHLTIEAAPVIQMSTDLIDWRRMLKIWTNANGKLMVTVVTYADQPALFLRPFQPPSFTPPMTP